MAPGCLDVGGLAGSQEVRGSNPLVHCQPHPKAYNMYTVGQAAWLLRAIVVAKTI